MLAPSRLLLSALLLCLGAPALGATSSSGPVDANIFVNLAKKVVPSVVNIQTTMTVKSQYGRGAPDDLFRKFFEDFFRQHGGRGGAMPGPPPGGPNGDDDQDEEDPTVPGQPPRGSGPKSMSLGTGFVIDSSGLVMTNNHVVADADEIKIFFSEEEDEKPADGEVVGRDPELDLALIRVKTKRSLVALALGDSDALEVGEYVMAVGNPFGQGHSVTHGIISAKGRPAPDFVLAKYLQTDAPINPGNSGGPLLNLKGEVVGINNAIDARAQGIGFAIPINLVKKVLPQLKSKGSVARGYIGVLVNELTPELAAKIGVKKDLKAPFVTHVYPGEPADKAGLKPYDVILEFAGKPIRSSAELINQVTAVNVNDTVPIKVLRSGQEKQLSIKVAQRPTGQQLATKGREPKRKNGKKRPAHPDVGMELEDITPEIAKELGLPEKATGAVITSTAYGGPADQAGLARGDVILEVDRKAVRSADDFFAVVKDKKSYLIRVRQMDPQGRESFAVRILDLKPASDSQDK
jgi:serine protease Do